MARLFDLPAELLELILVHLTQPAYYSLSRVSKSLHDIVLPHLYSDITLLAGPSSHVPRVDRLFFNILVDPSLGRHVRSLRLGVKSHACLRNTRRSMPIKNNDQHRLAVEDALGFLKTWQSVVHAYDFRDGLESNDYGVFAALLFLLVLPTLRRVSIGENGDDTLRPLKHLLDNIRARSEEGNLLGLANIKEVIYNIDHETGSPYPQTVSNQIWQALLFPAMERLEIPATHDGGYIRLNAHLARSFQASSPLESLTSLTMRYIRNVDETLSVFLPWTPQLRTLICEAYYDSSQELLRTLRPPTPWLSLEQWNSVLKAVSGSLQTLVISVEFSHVDCTFFDQPDVKRQIEGRLDLRGFDQLHTLEVPVFFLTGEVFMWIGMNTNYLPYAPPKLRHLTLRTDMTDAQFVYPWDTSVRASGPTFQESKDESRVRDTARMDLTCILHLALILIDQLPSLQSFTLWQPPDPSLDFFGNQLEELRTSCKNKSITAKAIYPMLLRWKSPAHWNLVREVTLFDTQFPESGSFSQFYLGERQGIPLGLASQYHLGQFKKQLVHRHR